MSRLYVVSCISGTLWLVEAASSDDALANWEGERAVRVDPAEADEVEFLVRVGQSDVTAERAQELSK